VTGTLRATGFARKSWQNGRPVMSENGTTTRPATAAPRWTARLALALAAIALAGTAAQWLSAGPDDGDAAASDLAKLQRRVAALEDRIERGRADLDRLAATIGAESAAGDTLAGRIGRIEDALARVPGGGRARLLWQLEQAEYFLRAANAQENLAGDTAGALAALALADEHLRDAADPRLGAVRKLVAGEMAALRAVPRVDAEGLVLKIDSLAKALPDVPRKQGAPASFSAEPAPPAPGSGVERLVAAVRNALLTLVSVRRTDAPPATLLSDESADLLMRSLDLELQMARLAVLRGENAPFRASLEAVRRALDQHFDTAAPAGAAALAALEEIGTARLPESLPDISGSLAELLRLREREFAS
jgi:uroporphyrin-3 C-methyltransferase